MKFPFLLASILFILCLSTSCKEEESLGVTGINSITGTLTYGDQQFTLMGGLVELKFYENDILQGTYYKIKVSDLPVHPANMTKDSIVSYLGGSEKATLIFSIPDIFNDEAPYQYSALTSDDQEISKDTPIFFSPIIGLGKSHAGGSSMNIIDITNGTLRISGHYPELRLEGEFVTEDNINVTFEAEGTFVNQQNWESFEMISM